MLMVLFLQTKNVRLIPLPVSHLEALEIARTVKTSKSRPHADTLYDNPNTIIYIVSLHPDGHNNLYI